jgi:hypothetical protein
MAGCYHEFVPSQINHISQHLAELEAKLLSAVPPEQAPVLAWPWVCGTKVAQITKAISFAEGELLISVGDDAWQKQLQDLSRTYLQRFQQVLPGKVLRVRFEHTRR